MIRLKFRRMDSLPDLHGAVQQAIALEFATLPPYLYALYTMKREQNEAAFSRLHGIVLEEMIHLCLACNILNAIGGEPDLVGAVPSLPGPLPFSIGSEGDEPFIVHLLPFALPAMHQGMQIEEPEEPLEFPKTVAFDVEQPHFQTIGQFYEALDAALKLLPADAWHTGRHQIGDQPFFQGELFPISDYTGASKAIARIVSQGEGSSKSPLTFENELAHFYRFEEIHENRVLEQDPEAEHGYRWGPPLGVDYEAVYPAIPDPMNHDLSGHPEAQAAQDACNRAFTGMVDHLQSAMTGTPEALGNAVRDMFDLRMATLAALQIDIGGGKVAGPAFQYQPELADKGGAR